MNEIFFWMGMLAVGLIVLSKIPGLEHMVKPVIGLFFSLIQFVAENATNWLIWLFKLLWGSHLELLKHLVVPIEVLDPSAAVRDKA
jgi:hypothetical protein